MSGDTSSSGSSTESIESIENSFPASSNDSKLCWICHCGEDDDEWVHPCRCTGGLQWAHQNCILLSIERKRLNSPWEPVNCDKCKYQYQILPKPSSLLLKLDFCDRYLYLHSLGAIPVFGTFSLYMTSYWYGYLTIIMTFGKNEGSKLLSQIGLWSYLALPAIPASLILFEKFDWEERLLLDWLKNDFSLMRYVLGKPPPRAIMFDIGEDILCGRMIEPVSKNCRRFAEVMLLPTMATIAGFLLFPFIKSNVKRNLLGGLIWTLASGGCKIYLRHQLFILKLTSKVSDCSEEPQS